MQHSSPFYRAKIYPHEWGISCIVALFFVCYFLLPGNGRRVAPDYNTVQLGWTMEQVHQVYGTEQNHNLRADDVQWGYNQDGNSLNLTFHDGRLIAIVVLDKDFRRLRYSVGGPKTPQSRTSVADAIEILAPGRLAAQGAKETTVLQLLGDPDRNNQGVWDYQCADGWLRVWLESGLVVRAEPIASP